MLQLPMGTATAHSQGRDSRKELPRMNLREEGLQKGRWVLGKLLIPGWFWETPLLGFLFCCPLFFVFLFVCFYHRSSMAMNWSAQNTPRKVCPHARRLLGDLTFLNCHLIPPGFTVVYFRGGRRDHQLVLLLPVASSIQMSASGSP